MERKASWDSECPVLRGSHNWNTMHRTGYALEAFCSHCQAKWIGVDAEWELYERGIKEYIYSKELGGWARFDKVQGF